MTYADALEYVNKHGWSKTNFGLERTRALLRAMGDPQKKLRFVHVAGTNGKGSTCAMLAAVLGEAGFRTGLYTSPYIQDFRERMQVNGVPVGEAQFARITERMIAAAEAMPEHPTHFEMITAIAMQYFLEERCDIVVLEVGMGGELDSTNVIDSPEVAVITNIGLDHTEFLGDTVEKIAETKSGIIKPGCDCVCYDGDPAAVAVVRRVCGKRGVTCIVPKSSDIALLDGSTDGQNFSYRGNRWHLSLLGRHQLMNAAVVLETLALLRSRGFDIPESAVSAGLSSVKWPARFEILRCEPLFILDGGHNPQCAQALTECLDEYLPGRKLTFLMGMLADKDYEKVLDIVAPYASRFICVRPASPRALDPAVLAALAEKRGVEAVSYEDTAAAVRLCRQPETGDVIAFGSLYAAGEIRTLMGYASGEYLCG